MTQKRDSFATRSRDSFEERDTIAPAEVIRGDSIFLFFPCEGTCAACTGAEADDDERDCAPESAVSRGQNVIDAAGSSFTLKIALDLVRPNGRITKVGWGPQPLGFSLDPLVQKNVTLQGSFSHNWPVWERVIALMASGQLDVKPIIGGVWPITEWHEAFEKMHKGEVVKSVLKPV